MKKLDSESPADQLIHPIAMKLPESLVFTASLPSTWDVSGTKGRSEMIAAGERDLRSGFVPNIIVTLVPRALTDEELEPAEGHRIIARWTGDTPSGMKATLVTTDASGPMAVSQYFAWFEAGGDAGGLFGARMVASCATSDWVEFGPLFEACVNASGFGLRP